MIPITEDELASLLTQKLTLAERFAGLKGTAFDFREYTQWCASQQAIAHQLAHLMLTSEQMYDMLVRLHRIHGYADVWELLLAANPALADKKEAA